MLGLAAIGSSHGASVIGASWVVQRAFVRMRIGLLLTAITIGGLAIAQAFAPAIRHDWLAIVVFALFGEALLILLAARRGGPLHKRDEPLPAPNDEDQLLPQPDPLGVDPQWLWNLLPPVAVGLVLFLAILLMPTS